MARKKKRGTGNNYFTQQTEDAIIKYNNSESLSERSKIFGQEIYTPLYKLAENLIHTFKFYYLDNETIEDLKLRVVTMLCEEKLHKFDPENGAKAYSYFGTIAKRWLIQYNKKNYRKLKRMGSFDDIEEQYEEEEDVKIGEGISLSDFIELWVERTYMKLDEMFPKDSDRQVADAILIVFKKRHDMEILKKKALYIYIREITGCETPHLTKVTKKLKDDFYKNYRDVLEKGKLEVE